MIPIIFCKLQNICVRLIFANSIKLRFSSVCPCLIKVTFKFTGSVQQDQITHYQFTFCSLAHLWTDFQSCSSNFHFLVFLLFLFLDHFLTRYYTNWTSDMVDCHPPIFTHFFTFCVNFHFLVCVLVPFLFIFTF